MRNFASDDEIQLLRKTYSQALYSGKVYPKDLPLILLLNECLSNQGSLIRAQICYLSMVCRDQDIDRSANLAIALEYYHLASLMLDDLPCMDDGETRRGRTCVHKVYGEASTILASLVLINRAYLMIWSVLSDLSSELRVQAGNLLDDCLGLNGLLLGQSLDLGFSQAANSLSNITEIADRKTGSLFKLSFVLPALISNAPTKEMILLKRLSMFFGRIYQLIDDFKDCLNSEILTGKSPRDYLLDRPNLVIKLGHANSFKYLSRLLEISAKIIKRLEQLKNIQSVKSIKLYRELLSEFGDAKDEFEKVSKDIFKNVKTRFSAYT